MVSKLPSLKSCILDSITRILSKNGLAWTFSLACWQAFVSMSMAVTCDCGKRCAIMSAINPVPVPMSRIRNPLPDAHAPSRTPSVPTFMPQRSWWMVNCLKENTNYIFSFFCNTLLRACRCFPRFSRSSLTILISLNKSAAAF